MILAVLVLRASVLIALLACAPTLRATGYCPTLTASAVDFTLGATGLAASAYEYNRGARIESLAFAGGAMLTLLASNLAECRP